MIRRLHIERLKGFADYTIEFGELNLLVGGNNSGKTTIFHALQLAFWCMDRTVDIGDSEVTFRKTQVPELGSVPYFEQRDLFFGQHVREGRNPARIKLTVETSAAAALTFDIYTAFSRNLMIDGGEQRVARGAYENLLALKPVYVPGTIGITVREELYRVIAQERLIAEGRQNQVLRNLVYRLRADSDSWASFCNLVTPLFRLQGIDVPFDECADEWLTAVYKENDCQFDFVSAGSGFLQVINILSFLLLHTSRVALLDEPDSHMHDDLQRVTFAMLERLGRERNIQLIIATHSATLIDVAGLKRVLLIDRNEKAPLAAQDVERLIPLLGDRGLALPPTKVMDTLKSRRALFVEGTESDYKEFLTLLGEKVSPGFAVETRGLTVFQTGGGSQKWPFDAISYFEQLLGVQLKYVFISDRDFLTDEEVDERCKRARADNHSLLHWTRRNRESYLLEPAAIERVLRRKWQQRKPADPFPDNLSAGRITQIILEKARELETDTQSTLTVTHEPSLRGDAEHRKEGTLRLNEYFKAAYREPVERGEVPYKLLDAKQVLRNLRTYVTEAYSLSFSDCEIISELRADEIPKDLRDAIDCILRLFASDKPEQQKLWK